MVVAALVDAALIPAQPVKPSVTVPAIPIVSTVTAPFAGAAVAERCSARPVKPGFGGGRTNADSQPDQTNAHRSGRRNGQQFNTHDQPPSQTRPTTNVPISTSSGSRPPV